MSQVTDDLMDLRYSSRQKVSATSFSNAYSFCSSNKWLNLQTHWYYIITTAAVVENKVLLLSGDFRGSSDISPNTL